MSKSKKQDGQLVETPTTRVVADAFTPDVAASDKERIAALEHFARLTSRIELDARKGERFEREQKETARKRDAANKASAEHRATIDARLANAGIASVTDVTPNNPAYAVIGKAIGKTPEQVELMIVHGELRAKTPNTINLSGSNHNSKTPVLSRAAIVDYLEKNGAK